MSHIDKRILDILAKAPLFSSIDSETISKLFKKEKYELISLGSGEEISVKNVLVLVISGTLEAYKNENGKKVYLKIIKPFELTGIATLFDTESRYISTFLAKKNSEILLMREELILSILRTSPDFSESFSRLLCDKLRYLNSRIDTYTQSNVEDRLLEFIKASANKQGERPFIEMSMMSLSSALGVGRASLYRALSSLEENETIFKEGKKIYLLK